MDAGLIPASEPDLGPGRPYLALEWVGGTARMKILNILLSAFRALQRNKMRSFLTMLGIIIGVAAVIAMLAIGQGAEYSVKQQISALGTNVLIVFPGSQQQGGSQNGGRDDDHADRRGCGSHPEGVSRSGVCVAGGTLRRTGYRRQPELGDQY